MNSCVYIIQNVKTGDVYVGKANNSAARWRRHQTYSSRGKSHLYRAMRKHGIDSFEFSVVERYAEEAEAFSAERSLIEYLRVMGASLYNENDGGLGQSRGKTWKLSAENRKNQSEAQKKRLSPSDKQKKAISEKLRGRSLSDEHRSNIGLAASKINKGRIHTDKARQNMRQGHLGATLTDEHRKHISDGNRRRWERWRQERATQTQEITSDVNATREEN